MLIGGDDISNDDITSINCGQCVLGVNQGFISVVSRLTVHVCYLLLESRSNQFNRRLQTLFHFPPKLLRITSREYSHSKSLEITYYIHVPANTLRFQLEATWYMWWMFMYAGKKILRWVWVFKLSLPLVLQHLAARLLAFLHRLFHWARLEVFYLLYPAHHRRLHHHHHLLQLLLVVVDYRYHASVCVSDA